MEPLPSRRTAAFHRHEAELDIGARGHREPVGKVAWIIAAALVAAAVFGSEALYRWAFDLPLWLGPVREGLVAAANGWNQAMSAIGATQFHDDLRNAFRQFQYLAPSD